MTGNSFRFRASILIAVAALATMAAAQRGGSSGSSSPPRSTPPSRATNTPDVSTQPLFISGKVLLQGGGVLPEPVPIERVCGGTVRREGYTDFKGQFGFQLGAAMTFQDASENDSRIAANAQTRSNAALRRPLDVTGCEFRAVLAGYQSSTVVLHSGGDWQTDVGTIFLQRVGDARGTTISVTSMAAPRDAMRAYEKAQKIRQEKPREAEKELNKATGIYPQFAAAWTALGDLHRQQEQFEEARGEYQKAMAADPQFVNPVYGLAMIEMQQKHWDEAIQRTGQVLKMNAPAFPLAYFFNAAANYNQQKFDAAEESARKYKALDTRHSHPDVCLLLSYVYSRKQDYAGAAREIRDYLAAVPDSPDAESLKSDALRYEQMGVSAQRD